MDKVDPITDSKSPNCVNLLVNLGFDSSAEFHVPINSFNLGPDLSAKLPESFIFLVKLGVTIYSNLSTTSSDFSICTIFMVKLDHFNQVIHHTNTRSTDHIM